jgi:protein-S-isoprenylcysteine O-methyltransferase Ste14
VSATRVSTTRGLLRSDKGEGWVAAQLVLFALIFASWFFGEGVTYAGLVLAALGAALVAWSARQLGRSLTPFPKPTPEGELVQAGPFRVIRHPIYVGGVLVFAGLSLVFSVYGVALTAVLAVFWLFKARLEERLLAERFPEYAEYRSRTWF